MNGTGIFSMLIVSDACFVFAYNDDGRCVTFFTVYSTQGFTLGYPCYAPTGRFYLHNHLFEESFGKIVPDTLQNNAFGFYGYADQKVNSRSGKSLGLFIQTGYSPSKEVVNNFYIGMGINYTGLLSSKGKDILGLVFACEHFTNH